MKKQYKKPLVAVEHFSIVQTTARDCWDSILQDQVTFSDKPCVWDFGGGIVFTPGDSTTMKPCDIDGDMFVVCYNNPGEGQYIFRS